MGFGTHLFGQTGDFVRPEVLGSDRVVRVAVEQEVLEEAHVLEAEEGDLMLWLEGVSLCSPRAGNAGRRT
jgi:hypothetical protein